MAVTPYYRTKAQPSMAPSAAPAAPTVDTQLQDQADAATLGPLRALFGQQVQEIEVPCAISPLGVVNRAVLLKRNDSTKPMYVRVRLTRNTTEGRIGIGVVNSINGQLVKQPMEWVDLTTEPGRRFEAQLGANDALFAIGTWPGVVPLSVFVSVVAWNP